MIYKYTSILGVLRLAVVERKREVKLHIVKKKKKKKKRKERKKRAALPNSSKSTFSSKSSPAFCVMFLCPDLFQYF